MELLLVLLLTAPPAESLPQAEDAEADAAGELQSPPVADAVEPSDSTDPDPTDPADTDAASHPTPPPPSPTAAASQPEGHGGAQAKAPAHAPPRRDERWERIGRAVTPTVLLEADYRQRAHLSEGTSGFAIPRARLGTRVRPTDRLEAMITAELAGDGGPFLIDGFATFTPVAWLEVTAGYSRPPLFASFRHEPVHSLPMPMRSPVVTAMWIRRDAGAEARLRPRRAPVETIVRLGNGAPGLLGNDNVTPTGYAALDLVLGRARVNGHNRQLGLRAGVASLLDDAEAHDSVAGRTPLGFTYARPVVAGGLRSISEAHIVGYAGPVRLVAEGALAHESRRMDDDGDAATPPVEVDGVQAWGLTTELVWTIRGSWREVGQQPSGPDGPQGRWGGGALELAGRFDRLWLGRGTSEVANGGGTTGSLSLKWWATSFLALDLYGDATRFDVGPVETPDRLWSWTALVRGSFIWGRGPLGALR